MKEARRWGSLAILSLLILGIGAAMAVPNSICTTLSSNSVAAQATLRALVMQQERFRAFGGCDVDGDGAGEYGTFGELTGFAGVRADPLGRSRGGPLAEPLLSAALARPDRDGVVLKSGYAFRILLPARGGGAAREGRPGAPFDRPVDTDAAEASFCAYAWPLARTAKDPRAYFVAAKGDVFAARNADLRYFGIDGGPAWDGAFPAGTGGGWSAPAAGARYVGRDGGEWRPVN